MQFFILHFAGKVTYNIDGFFEKNVNPLGECTMEMLEGSYLSIMQELYPKGVMFVFLFSKIIPKYEEKHNLFCLCKESADQKGKKKCIGAAFVKSLQTLIKEINSTTPHFIRCVKPNTEKKPLIWERQMSYEQLKFGVI